MTGPDQPAAVDAEAIARVALDRLRGQPPKRPQIDMVDERGQMLLTIKSRAALDLVIGACRYLAPATGAHAVAFINDTYISGKFELDNDDQRSLTQRFRDGDPNVHEAIMVSVRTRTTQSMMTQPYRRVGKNIVLMTIAESLERDAPDGDELPTSLAFGGWISDGLQEALLVEPAVGDLDLLVKGLAMVFHKQGSNVVLAAAPQFREAIAEARRRLRAEAGTWAAADRERELAAEALAYARRMRERNS